MISLGSWNLGTLLTCLYVRNSVKRSGVPVLARYVMYLADDKGTKGLKKFQQFIYALFPAPTLNPQDLLATI